MDEVKQLLEETGEPLTKMREPRTLDMSPGAPWRNFETFMNPKHE